MILFQKQVRIPHLAGAGHQVKEAFLAGEDILPQDQDHVALYMGDFGGGADPGPLGGEAAFTLDDLHPALGRVHPGAGVIEHLVGLEEPGPPLETLVFEERHFIAPSQAARRQQDEPRQDPECLAPHTLPFKSAYHNIGLSPVQDGRPAHRAYPEKPGSWND